MAYKFVIGLCAALFIVAVSDYLADVYLRVLFCIMSSCFCGYIFGSIDNDNE
jgi:surface polysaccharide O-acyltransferase-like enzyme